MLELHLYHGSTNPELGATDLDGNPVDDWGFEGPLLKGVKALYVTYVGTFRVEFVSEEARDTAQQQTGWPGFSGELDLSMTLADDMVKITSPEHDARHEYFGDWSLQAES